MPIQQIKDLGSGGVNLDTPPYNLPPNVFTNVLNVRFDNTAVEKITGEQIYLFSLSINPTFGIHWKTPGTSYNILASNNNIVKVDANNNISSMFSTSDTNYDAQWNGCTYNGGFAIIMNNGKTTPKFCLYNDPSAGNSFQPLPGWNYLSNLQVTAKVIKPIRNSLIAANLTITDTSTGLITRAPGTIRISVQAAPGYIPTVWQPGTTTDTADEFELSSTSPILEIADLRGNTFVYSSDSIHIVSVGPTITNVKNYTNEYGILSDNCVAEFNGQHFVVDRNDIYVHGGSGQIESVANLKVRDYFFNNLNQTYKDLVHVTKNSRQDEIWVSYPKGSSTKCNEALIFNYRLNTWTIRSLPNTTYTFKTLEISSGNFLEAKEVLAGVTGTSNAFIYDRGYLMWNGSSLAAYNSFVERKKFVTGDLESSTEIDAVYPIFDSVPSNSEIEIIVTGQNNYTIDDDLNNPDPRDIFVFQPNNARAQGYKVDPRVSGRLVNYKLSSEGSWRLATIGIGAKAKDRR
jgi:hypothetical protein